MYLEKGRHIEQYTAFCSKSTNFRNWTDYTTTDWCTTSVSFHKDEIVEICGLAGDVCVMNTAIALKDINPVIIDNLTASLDNNNFRSLADQNNITIIEV